jgi:flagellar biosynthesis/type III secretory pathway chaperone
MTVKKHIGSIEDNKKIEKLTDQKNEMLKQFKELAKLKKKLYSKVDISSAMSPAEKELNKKMSSISSDMFQMIREIQKLVKK